MSGQNKIVYPKITISNVLKAFWNGIRPQKWKLFVMVLSLALGNVVIIITPLFYKHFFDVIVASNNNSSVAPVLLQIIIYIGLLHGVFWLFYRFAEFANNTYVPMTMANLKQQSYNHLIEHSYGFFTNNFVGSLVQRVNRFSRAFERLSDNIVWNLLPLIVRVCSVLVVLFFINKWIDLVVLIWVAVFLSFNIAFSRWKLKYDIKAAEIDSKATGYLADTITNQNTIALFNGTQNEKRGYKSVTGEQSLLMRFRWNLDAIVNAVQGLLSFGIEFVLFYFAIRYWGEGLITVGVFVLLQAYAGSLIDQLWGFTRIVRDMYEAYADAKEMVEIMTLPHEIQDIPKANQASLRKSISLVPQDPVLFHRSLTENIAYGKSNASRKEIEKAAKLAHCDEFIKMLPNELETLVGERGIKLSRSERQRVAIARAILKNAPILILDEATSSLDSHSEMLIQDALNTLMAGKTTIVIAHRLSTIQKMDRIIVIDHGRIIEEGSHEVLLTNENSLYKKLWTLQAGGFLTDKEELEEDNQEEVNYTIEE